ncbi:MAG TPA: hypothetical protein VFH57_02030 [Gammaproteobacteria bacterium]|nr:hypothetical protein [Gammaproteobacteria bacterium]
MSRRLFGHQAEQILVCYRDDILHSLRPRFSIVRVSDGSADALVELAAVDDDLLEMHRLDCLGRNAKIAGIFYVNQQAVREDFPHRAKLGCAIAGEDQVTRAYFLRI